MQITQLQLQNFRCYENLTLDLHPNLTVLVAINGEGKTSLLDAIRIGLWPFVSQFDLAHTGYNDPANTITIDDVRTIQLEPSSALNSMARQLPCKLQIETNFGNQICVWERLRKSEAPRSQTLDGEGVRRIKYLAEELQAEIRLPESHRVDLPLFGYYGTGRLWSHKRITSNKRAADIVDRNIRTIAYQDCLDPASSFRQFEEWFSHVFKVAREQQIKALEQGSPIKLEDTHSYQLIRVVQRVVDLVLKPIGWQGLSYSEHYDQSLVLVHEQQGTMKVSQLSDGIKNMLGMVADIAYRCALLNSHLGERAAEETQGVVMIDEVDMHLHPQWQQTVLGSLEEAFPRLQFIVTTHSPQVLTTVASECIRLIENGRLYAAPKGSQGAEASRILETVFDVRQRPPLQNNTKKLEEYVRLVYSDQWESARAVRLREELDAIFAGSEPKLLELDLYIENRAWELSLEKD